MRYFFLILLLSGCVTISSNYRINVNKNNELDPYSGYEYKIGTEHIYMNFRTNESRIRWGGQHGGKLDTDIIGIGIRYPIKKDKVSISPWIQLEKYNINADLEHGVWTKERRGSHWEALYRKQNEIVNDQKRVAFDNYSLDIDDMYGVSFGFDIGYELIEHFTLELGGGYSYVQAPYAIRGWYDNNDRNWHTHEHLDMSQYFGTIGIRIDF